MSLPESIKREAPQVLWPTSTQSQSSVQASDILSQIGNTPLLDLGSIAHQRGVAPNVGLFAKAEWFNPSGSVKARAALRIVEDAEHNGDLIPGKILIDSSSGNTAVALALIGAVKGYKVHLVMPQNVSQERKALVRAYGARLFESNPLEGSDGAIRKVREMVAVEPGKYFYANQYNNAANWKAHYDTTGPEIWRQTNGAVTHFVAGLGTSGTLTGTGRYLKARNSGVQVVALQPEDDLSVIEGLKHLGTAMVPGIYDDSVPDRQLDIGAEAAWTMTRLLAREVGLFVGLSAGAAIVGALEIAGELDRGTVVTILPDDGSKYVSLGIFD